MKVAIVTGSSRGIGRSTCIELSNKGYSLVLCSRDLELLKSLQEELHSPSIIVEGDITDNHIPGLIVEKALQTYGRIDALVNNAGGDFHEGSSLTIKEKHINRTFHLNFTSVLQMCQHCIPIMIKQGKGSIVNVSSILSEFPDTNHLVYACSKASIETLTKSLALEFSKQNIRVNCVSPGYTDTELTQDISENIKRHKHQHISLNRFATNFEIAKAIVFLTGDDSSYCNGTILKINGGSCLGF